MRETTGSLHQLMKKELLSAKVIGTDDISISLQWLGLGSGSVCSVSGFRVPPNETALTGSKYVHDWLNPGISADEHQRIRQRSNRKFSLMILPTR